MSPSGFDQIWEFADGRVDLSPGLKGKRTALETSETQATETPSDLQETSASNTMSVIRLGWSKVQVAASGPLFEGLDTAVATLSLHASPHQQPHGCPGVCQSRVYWQSAFLLHTAGVTGTGESCPQGPLGCGSDSLPRA